jgi:hypothetical protein
MITKHIAFVQDVNESADIGDETQEFTFESEPEFLAFKRGANEALNNCCDEADVIVRDEPHIFDGKDWKPTASLSDTEKQELMHFVRLSVGPAGPL